MDSELRREVKNLVVEKKLEVWNDGIGNSDFEGHREDYCWLKETQDMKRGITVLRNSAGVLVTGAKGKLEVLKRHYQHLMYSVDRAFDDSWKEEVDKKVCEFSNLPAPAPS